MYSTTKNNRTKKSRQGDARKGQQNRSNQSRNYRQTATFAEMAEFAQVIRDIQHRKFAPVYFLQGEEPFFIDNIMEHVESLALEESQKSFNQYVFYGKETSFEQVVSTARKFPMMGERQVILVKEAQEMRGWQKEQDQKLLMDYLENPMPSTILAFAYKYKTIDKRKKIGKLIEKQTVSVLSKSLYENQVPGWIKGYVKAVNASITDQAVMLLAENIGNNLQRLSQEVQKLLLNTKEDKKIDEQLVHTYVGISKEYNTFELQKAIGFRNEVKALKIVKYFAENPKNNPLILTLFSLYSYFSKLLQIHEKGARDPSQVSRVIGVHPNFAKEYLAATNNYSLPLVVRNLDYLHKADLQSKGIDSIGMKEKEVLTELIYKLMN